VHRELWKMEDMMEDFEQVKNHGKIHYHNRTRDNLMNFYKNYPTDSEVKNNGLTQFYQY
jgi:hypothetical protein